MSREERVELRWPGKREADEAAPAGLELEVEQRVGAGEPAGNLLICADNLRAMQALQATHAGAIDLIYLDPPFATGHDFVRTSFAGPDGEGRGELKAHAYHDRWPGGLAGFLRMLEPRLRLCHRLLAPQGSLYLHVDPTVGHYAKLVLDEVFGAACFQREIVWRIGWLSGYKTRANNWIRNHDLIFFYTKDPARFTFNKQYVPHPAGYRRRDGAAARSAGVPMEDVWNANVAEFALRGRDSLDSIQIKSFSREKTGWATQKNTSLLRRIVAASSRPGDVVADFFCGSGTTLVAAAELGRRFIGCDCALPAVEVAHARLLELRADVPEDMSEPVGVGFDRCGLGLAERRLWLGEGGAGEHVARLLRHHGAAPLGPGALHGLRGAVGVVIGPWDAPLGRAAVQAALAEAAAQKLTGLDALAWSWEFPADEDLSVGTGLALTCLQLRRELLDDRALAREDGGLGERPRFAFEWRAGPEQTVQLVLSGATLQRPERLAPDLRAALADWRELVESWSVEFMAAGGPLRAGQRQHRTRNQRGLVCESAVVRHEGAGPFWARVEVVDRLGAAHPLDFTLSWSDGQLDVAQGRPEAR
jgi:adenine-specific DNA-methyltransferase